MSQDKELKSESKPSETTRLNNEEEEDTDLPSPPDGGYGWVIVAASFFCNMVVDGIAYTFGVFLNDFINHFGEPAGKTAWVGSLLSGMYMSAGPIVSALTNKYGCRAVCIAGSLISTSAFVLSTLSPTVNVLMLTYGFMGGVGFGLIYLPAVVCVGYYFESKRSLATGIAVCGSGVGTFAFAPLASILLNVYGWKGANLILAGIILNCAACGALMRPLEYPKKASKMVKNDLKSLSYKELSTKDSKVDCESLNYTSSKMSLSSHGKHHMVRPLSRKDIFYSGSIANLSEFQSQKSLKDYRQSIHSLAKSEKPGGSKLCGCIVLPEGLKSALGQMMDTSLLKNPVFMMIGISNLFAMAGLYVPFVYLVDVATKDGIHISQASFLISIIGITNTIGRIACGYFADFPQVNALFINNICLVIATIAVALTPFCHSYIAYVIVAIFFGLAIAGYISLSSIILVDLLGLEKLTNAFGLLILFRGAAAIIGSPLAGGLYDMTKTYDLPFFVAGGLFAISALTSFAAPLFKRSESPSIESPEVLSPINEDENENNDSKDR